MTITGRIQHIKKGRQFQNLPLDFLNTQYIATAAVDECESSNMGQS